MKWRKLDFLVPLGYQKLLKEYRRFIISLTIEHWYIHRVL